MWRALDRVLAPAQRLVSTLRERPRWLAARAVVGLALLVAGMLALVAGTVAADGLLAIFERTTTSSSPRFPLLATLAWLSLVGSVGLGARDPRRRGQAGFCWALLVIGRAASGAVGAPDATLGWLLPAVICAALALRPWRPPVRSIGPVMVGVLVGPTAATYAFANGVPVVVAPLIPGVLGGLLGAAVGWWLARRPDPAARSPLGLAALLALVVIGSILPLYVGVAWGIDRPLALGVFVVATPLLLVRRVPFAVPPWLVFYGCYVIVQVFRVGPGEAECASVADLGRGELLMAAPAGGQPYDVAAHPSTGTVVASFKQIGDQGGFLEVFDPSDPSLRGRLRPVRPDGAAGPFWPERLELDAARDRLWVQMLGIGAYAMWELAVDRPEPDSAPGLVVTARMPIGWEPGNPAIDSKRRRLALSYVPNRQPDNPLAEVFDLDSLEPSTRTAKPVKRLEMADYLVVDPPTGNLLVPGYFDFVRFALVELKGDELTVVRRRETFHPTVGLAVDVTAQRIYVTNVLRGTVDVLDRDTLEPLAVLASPGFPRDVAWDESRGRLHVGGYADGVVRTYERTPDGLQLIEEVRTGSLLRGLGLDARTGTVYAASGCGVFAIPPGQ